MDEECHGERLSLLPSDSASTTRLVNGRGSTIERGLFVPAAKRKKAVILSVFAENHGLLRVPPVGLSQSSDSQGIQQTAPKTGQIPGQLETFSTREAGPLKASLRSDQADPPVSSLQIEVALDEFELLAFFRSLEPIGRDELLAVAHQLAARPNDDSVVAGEGVDESSSHAKALRSTNDKFWKRPNAT